MHLCEFSFRFDSRCPTVCTFHLPAGLCICQSVSQSVGLSVCLSDYPSICSSINNALWKYCVYNNINNNVGQAPSHTTQSGRVESSRFEAESFFRSYWLCLSRHISESNVHNNLANAHSISLSLPLPVSGCILLPVSAVDCATLLHFVLASSGRKLVYVACPRCDYEILSSECNSSACTHRFPWASVHSTIESSFA